MKCRSIAISISPADLLVSAPLSIRSLPLIEWHGVKIYQLRLLFIISGTATIATTTHSIQRRKAEK